jgi:alkanesulfonate monooxygenase SsuD/methylene tetrahydromethanopterin reductase-like flavin-dependent oxidoreductase (luciferase family)
MVHEHHVTSDGYLPTPVTMAAALAARTSHVPIVVSLVVLPLYHPIRLAEEMCVVDHLSEGRVSYVGGVGYRPVEYEMYGLDFHRRGRVAEESLALLLRAKTGDAFQHHGRNIQVTPAPFTPGGPAIAWGGGSIAAAERAGRHGLDFSGFRGSVRLRLAYEEASRTAGHEPGICSLPGGDQPAAVFVADNPDRAWSEIGEYLLHDARSNAEWNRSGSGTSTITFAETVDTLRREARTYRIMTPDEACDHVHVHGALPMHPLIGGLPPAIAWRYLKAAVDVLVPDHV